MFDVCSLCTHECKLFYAISFVCCCLAISTWVKGIHSINIIKTTLCTLVSRHIHTWALCESFHILIRLISMLFTLLEMISLLPKPLPVFNREKPEHWQSEVNLRISVDWIAIASILSPQTFIMCLSLCVSSFCCSLLELARFKKSGGCEEFQQRNALQCFKVKLFFIFSYMSSIYWSIAWMP